MAKKGGSKHVKRITISRTLPLEGRKRIVFGLNQFPGPHPKSKSIALGTLMRDVLHIGHDLRECKRIIAAGDMSVDGKVVREIRRPVGIMDIIEAPKALKAWRMQVVDKKLMPKEISGAQAKAKLCKVVRKTTIKGGKISVTTHDGRTLVVDNNVKVGSTLKMAIPTFKLTSQIPLKSGVRCLITDGKHAGEIATLEAIIERVGSMDSEAKMQSGNESFITVTKYLFVVDDEFA